MPVCVALLRGGNVGGDVLKMDRLLRCAPNSE
jgi:hypothetical protein